MRAVVGPESFAFLLRPSASGTAVTLVHHRVRVLRVPSPPLSATVARLNLDWFKAAGVRAWAKTALGAQLVAQTVPVLTFSSQATFAFSPTMKGWARVADTYFDLSDYKVAVEPVHRRRRLPRCGRTADTGAGPTNLVELEDGRPVQSQLATRPAAGFLASLQPQVKEANTATVARQLAETDDAIAVQASFAHVEVDGVGQPGPAKARPSSA